ncbi:DegT/DnrJ/EryC1/StrS aminotransferase family protein [Mucilaginibacter sp.]|uniref:DegT/DnrJ/EryC1/StrS family aminotransferase n=1 Tax=Mucilaginibacter sp. TaxID=1882438 RepID=UPI00262EDF87|nr:DegT/DnrJ/EryC1/StrS family aminotransferase [Mucilaginibacter sp.]
MKIGRYMYEKQFGEHPDELFIDLKRMILNGNYVLTEEVSTFLKNFAMYTDARYACGTNSGTDALILAMKVLNIGPGDEVITHANTFYATVAAIKFVGATPVLVDADEETYLINTHQLEDKITGKTKAIIPVHLYGKPSPMQEIMNLADKHNLLVIEDCAQAHGSKLDGQCIGTFGKIGCFSFHPSKNLAAAGDGGCLVTNDEDLYIKSLRISALGQNGQNNHVVLGFNSKLDAIQARILDWKLPFLDSWNKARNRIVNNYIERLNGLPIKFQLRSNNELHTYHQFTVRTTRRDELLASLTNKGIDAVIRYPTPIHLQPAFEKEGWKQGEFPVAEALAKELLCLPLRPDMTANEVDYVSENVRQFFNT